MSTHDDGGIGRVSRRGALALGLGIGATLLTGPLPAAADPTQVTVKYQRQQTQSWCSAASTRIALSAKNRERSQAALADLLNLPEGQGLQDPYQIARVLNQCLAGRLAGGTYTFRQPAAGTLKEQLQRRVRQSIGGGFPVVINMNRVGPDPYGESGHYIAIIGFRSGQYLISDPDEPARQRIWYSEANIVAWNKWNRFTAWTP